MKQKQEPKYANDERGQIINRKTGEPIPDDEPVFIFRARDQHAVAVLTHYARLIINGPHGHTEAVHQRMEDFMAFRDANPDRMKVPD